MAAELGPRGARARGPWGRWPPAAALFLCCCCAGVALLAALPARGQGPAAPWRTLATPHFRLHYPLATEPWARHAAERLESIRDRVISEVGYAPPEVVDVLVSDPRAAANGEAFPILGWPRLVLWTNPPPPESEIGYYRDWSETLLVHEETHLVHLLRPSRNPLLHGLEQVLLPVGPIAVNAPRWVVEGYATLVEGKLTGTGRPYGDLRAAILRRWAQAGKLPPYPRLAADSQSWHGMSMAYLLGSAFLEWLEERGGPGSLRRLWARMTARAARSFDEAFRGVYGSSPDSLYDRFRAELTYRAMEAEKRVQAVGPLTQREGTLWQDLTWSTGAPAVSRDGQRLVLELRHHDKPAELVVFATAPDVEAEKRWVESQAKLLQRDPQDVPATRLRPLPRKPLFRLPASHGVEPAMPRFLPDGQSVLLVRFEPDAQGFLHPDLFRWWLDGGQLRRLTRQADLRDPDPSPDGSWAVAVRNRDGFSQLVAVDLAGGQVRALTEPSVEVVYDRPRISPDGHTVACVRHAAGVWKLALLEAGHPERGQDLASPGEGTVASPAWSGDGKIVYAVVGDHGFIDIYGFAADLPEVPRQATAAATPAAPGEQPIALTRTQGAALAPAPSPDGKALFYLSLGPDGLALYRLDLDAPQRKASLPHPEVPPELAPAVRPPVPAPAAPAAPLNTAEVQAGRPYGAGRQELLPILGGGASASGGALELGLRSGDVIGRFDLLALGSLAGSGGPRGGALAAAWRGWPVPVALHLFAVRELPSRQSGRLPAGAGLLDLERRGIEAGAVWKRLASGDRLRLDGRLLWQRLTPEADGRAPAAVVRALAQRALAPLQRGLDEGIAALAGSYGAEHGGRGEWLLGAELGAHLEAGRTGGRSWTRFGGSLGLGVGHGGELLQLGWRRDGSRGLTQIFDLYQLGGAPASVLPETALATRIAAPALAVGTLLGAQHEEQRAELKLGFLPVPLFFERHRLWLEGAARGAWLSLAGLEYRLSLRPYPVARLPALDLRLGLARSLSEPLKDQTRWWLATVWRP
ncbi:MAG TPA: hypothetical protein VHR45_16960 [Thermoanaerobaculia bacterium]|nr:hypothetical protein [Thermoanaerobaculia bacterium]